MHFSMDGCVDRQIRIQVGTLFDELHFFNHPRTALTWIAGLTRAREARADSSEL